MARHGKSWILALVAGLALAGCGAPFVEAEDESTELDGLEGKLDAPSKVKVAATKSSFTEAEDIAFSVTNGYAVTDIFLPGCTPAVLQRQSDTGWDSLPAATACLIEGITRVSAASTLTGSLPAKTAGTYRILIQFRTKCSGVVNFSECSSKVRQIASPKFLVEEETKMCGGIAGISCPVGQKCRLTGEHPDASGTCVAAAFCEAATAWDDCAALIHPACLGDWECVNSACHWQCGTLPSVCQNLGGSCLPLTSPQSQPECAATEVAAEGLGCGRIPGQTTTCCLPASACQGAWRNQSGLCLGPADQSLPDACCPKNDCRVMLCAPGRYCTNCWGTYQCIPIGAVC